MPGEEFSYENAIGPVIASNGYKYAPVISNGKLVDGIGGGVCQVSFHKPYFHLYHIHKDKYWQHFH
mgnify:CR=1 FL=1